MVELREPGVRSDRPTGTGRVTALVVILVGMFLDLMDGGVVNVALPSIQRDLSMGSAALQWLVAGYFLPLALFLIPGGRLGDIFGRKRIFMIGMALFAATSAVCSAAQNTETLLAGRVLQGLAAALMLPQVMAIIQVMYAPHERGRPITAAGSIYAISAVAGPVVGALLVESDIAGLGWRLIFLVNVPVAAVALVAAAFVVPESRSDTAQRLDLVGVALAAVGLFLILYPVVMGDQNDWPAWGFGSIAAGLAVLLLFVAHQRRHGESPLIRLSLFRHRSFTGGMLVVLLAMGGVYGLFLVITVYLQTGLGYSVMRAGLVGIWWGIASAVFAGLALNVLGPRLGRRVVQAGLVVVSAGILVLMWTVLHYNAQLSYGELVVPMLVGGAGMGLSVALVFDYALADVPVGEAGSASGILNAFQQVGSAIGVALVGALFFGMAPTNPSSGSWAADFSEAFARSLWLPIGMLAIAFAASCLLPRHAAHRDVI